MSLACDKSLGAALVGIMDASNQVLLTRTTSRPTVWQPLGGHIEVSDLDPAQTAAREVQEEIGVVLDQRTIAPVMTRPSDTEKRVNIHFYRARAHMPQGIKVQAEEILEVGYFPITKALGLPALPATQAFLRELASL